MEKNLSARRLYEVFGCQAWAETVRRVYMYVHNPYILYNVPTVASVIFFNSKDVAVPSLFASVCGH